MCGRYVVFTEEEEDEISKIIDEISIIYGDGSVKTGEVFPTDTAAVIKRNESRTIPLPLKWGFPMIKGKGVIINARAETASEKKMFSRALANNRCVIPSTGFFEWLCERDKVKDKYLLRRTSGKALYMAGIFETFFDVSGKRFDAFAILTSAANESVSHLHDRMPVILSREEIERWIFDTRFTREVLERTGPELTTEKQPKSIPLLVT